MKFSSIFASVLCAVSLPAVLAAPASSGLQKRDCPSVEDIEAWINENADVGANTVFYTAGATSQNAKVFAEEVGGTYWTAVYENQYLNWIVDCGEGEEQNKLLPRMGQALAQQSTLRAYVLMNPGQDANSFWNDNEYPYINKNLVLITAVNAGDFDDQKEYVHNQPF